MWESKSSLNVWACCTTLYAFKQIQFPSPSRFVLQRLMSVVWREGSKLHLPTPTTTHHHHVNDGRGRCVNGTWLLFVLYYTDCTGALQLLLCLFGCLCSAKLSLSLLFIFTRRGRATQMLSTIFLFVIWWYF